MFSGVSILLFSPSFEDDMSEVEIMHKFELNNWKLANRLLKNKEQDDIIVRMVKTKLGRGIE